MFFSLLRWSREARWPMENVDFLLLGVREFSLFGENREEEKNRGNGKRSRCEIFH